MKLNIENIVQGLSQQPWLFVLVGCFGVVVAITVYGMVFKQVRRSLKKTHTDEETIHGVALVVFLSIVFIVAIVANI